MKHKTLMSDLITNVPFFRDSLTSLKETSKDSAQGQYVTKSEAKVINFDRVVKKYVRKYARQCGRPNSVDALVLMDDRLAFIEFKNGEVHEEEVRRKVESSLLIFCDLTGKLLQFTREYMDFYVVCGLASKDPLTKLNKFLEIEAKLNLQRFKKLYFHDVYAYMGEDFEETARHIRPLDLKMIQ